MKLLTPEEIARNIKNKIGSEGKLAWIVSVIAGVISHGLALVSDFPNHDGLASMYFDQNMTTSGRWFLQAACGITSYFNLPWLIGVLSIVYLAFTNVVLVKLLKIKSKTNVVLISLLTVSFPVLASNFAYVFTMDGYMIGLLLCVAAVAFTGCGKYGFVLGAISLAFGMGCYQSYISVTMLLSLYVTVIGFLSGKNAKERVFTVARYLCMGIFGIGLYYVILRICLSAQNKVLDTYQGISDMSSTNGIGLFDTIKEVYAEFIRFGVKGHIFAPNKLSVSAIIVLTLFSAILFLRLVCQKKLYKKLFFYLGLIVVILLIPCLVNAIMFVSTDVTYHSLMKYQWVILPVLLIALSDYVLVSFDRHDKINVIASWATVVSVCILFVSYVCSDNIAYFNLNKKFDKTYAYCLRLADRIEQTEGYYRGIPIAMVGVVGNDNFPVTDITGDITGSILNVSGDYLLYTGDNYEQFFRHYLGITLNVCDEDYVEEFYYSDLYAAMPSFPDAGSTVVSDGILYIKTENVR